MMINWSIDPLNSLKTFSFAIFSLDSPTEYQIIQLAPKKKRHTVNGRGPQNATKCQIFSLDLALLYNSWKRISKHAIKTLWENIWLVNSSEIAINNGDPSTVTHAKKARPRAPESMLQVENFLRKKIFIVLLCFGYCTISKKKKLSESYFAKLYDSSARRKRAWKIRFSNSLMRVRCSVAN